MGGPLQNHLSIFQWELPAHLPQVDGQIVEQRGIHSLLQLGAARETPPVGCLAVLGPSPPPPTRGNCLHQRLFFLRTRGQSGQPTQPWGADPGGQFWVHSIWIQRKPQLWRGTPSARPPTPPGEGGDTPPGKLPPDNISEYRGRKEMPRGGGGRGHLWIPCGHRRLEIHVFLIKKPENKTPFFQVGIFQDCQGLNTGAGLIYF